MGEKTYQIQMRTKWKLALSINGLLLSIEKGNQEWYINTKIVMKMMKMKRRVTLFRNHSERKEQHKFLFNKIDKIHKFVLLNLSFFTTIAFLKKDLVPLPVFPCNFYKRIEISPQNLLTFRLNHFATMV